MHRSQDMFVCGFGEVVTGTELLSTLSGIGPGG